MGDHSAIRGDTMIRRILESIARVPAELFAVLAALAYLSILATEEAIQ